MTLPTKVRDGDAEDTAPASSDLQTLPPTERITAAPTATRAGRAGTCRAGVLTPFWTQLWFDHQNLRDHQAEACCLDDLWRRILTTDYLVKATTPVSITLLRPKPKKMYSPETFGRVVQADRVIVE